jgi:hypothetical protein
LKRDGKDTLKTEEGWAAVKEAIGKLNVLPSVIKL